MQVYSPRIHPSPTWDFAQVKIEVAQVDMHSNDEQVKVKAWPWAIPKCFNCNHRCVHHQHHSGIQWTWFISVVSMFHLFELSIPEYRWVHPRVQEASRESRQVGSQEVTCSPRVASDYNCSLVVPRLQALEILFSSWKSSSFDTVNRDFLGCSSVLPSLFMDFLFYCQGCNKGGSRMIPEPIWFSVVGIVELHVFAGVDCQSPSYRRFQIFSQSEQRLFGWLRNHSAISTSKLQASKPPSLFLICIYTMVSMVLSLDHCCTLRSTHRLRNAHSWTLAVWSIHSFASKLKPPRLATLAHCRVEMAWNGQTWLYVKNAEVILYNHLGFLDQLSFF